MDQRSTIREMSVSTGIAIGTLSRHLRKGTFRRRSTRIKPLLSDANKLERVQFCRSHALANFAGEAGSCVDFDPLWDVVHLDEKWFNADKDRRTVYLLPDEIPQRRSWMSKRFIPKVMFLAAVARIRNAEVSVISDDMIQQCVLKDAVDPANESATNDMASGTDTVDFAALRVLSLSFKNVFKIDNLVTLKNLVKLQMDNNVIQEIEGISHLTSLTWLDLSFNNIAEIKGLDTLTRLQDLTLYNNNISKLENLDTLKGLQVLSVGNNSLATTDGLLYLKCLDALRVLNLEGNPVCSDPEYRSFVLAHLDKLKYLDYSLVDVGEVVQAREQYQVYMSIYNWLRNLIDDFTEKVKTATEDIKVILLEKHAAIQRECDGFALEYAKEKDLTQKKSIAQCEKYRRVAKRLFKASAAGPPATEAEVARVTAESQAACNELNTELMGIESSLVEFAHDAISTLDVRIEAVGNESRGIATEHFRNVEQLENNFFDGVTQLAANLLERLATEDGEDDDFLSDECRAILNDRDALNNAINGSHDIHIGKLLAQEDLMREQNVATIHDQYFTLDKLRAFNGEGDKPIYIAIKGVVYDVSRKRDFYGPGEGYHLFAGREAARALAKMSFEPADLENTDISDLNFMEKEILKDWIDKFTDYNSYPIVGRVLQQTDLTRTELSAFTTLPVYVALRGVIYDVTLGGLEHYGPNGGYKLFAGRDATRALALMSFDQEHLDNPTEDGLTETQIKTLADWEAKFQSKYGVVGKKAEHGGNFEGGGSEDACSSKLVRGMFDLHLIGHHGLPSQPSRICYVPMLGLLVVATGYQQLKVYGEDGLEVYLPLREDKGDGTSSFSAGATPTFLDYTNSGKLVLVMSDSAVQVIDLANLQEGKDVVVAALPSRY
ncbi:hypothetical protein B5M09_007561 [Aphanomyces astaci]|uniref:Cytochrome b5 heme-binding domain-containing protein n=1 Tax=Aphanomyces astaci TaxID=112090 RepID=A0A425DPS1_APHAT|nr:hypothetical protein B5M09_007561 [Aphanomyces astaci]